MKVTGQEKIDIWRSETLTALTALPENENRIERASRRICDDLSGILSPWLLEAGPFAKVEERFRREILDPAIKFHQDLRSSSHRYDMRPISVIGPPSPKQMLDEWELKDADKWQRPRGEKGVGKALYCLHPPILRLRTQGRPPIVIAKAVMVVASPERERIPNLHSNKDSSQSNSNQRKAATHSFTQKQEYTHGSPRRQLSVPPESSNGRDDILGDSTSPSEKVRQSSGKPKKDQDVPPSKRGHQIEGTSKTFPSKVAARQPSRRGSRDTSNDKSVPRSSANKSSQPAIDPSTPAPSKPASKPRTSKFWNPLRF